MKDRGIPIAQIGIRSQEVSITLPNSRTYSVCSQEQMNALITNKKESLVAMMSDEELAKFGDKLEDHLKAEVEKYKEELPFATLNWLYDKMSEEERKKFKDQYRFGGVPRKWG